MTQLNFDHIIQDQNKKQEIKNARCLSCQHWEHWAIQSQQSMLLIEKKLIQREKALQDKMKQLKNMIQQQNLVILVKEKQFERLKIKDQQIILQLNQKILALSSQYKFQTGSSKQGKEAKIQIAFVSQKKTQQTNYEKIPSKIFKQENIDLTKTKQIKQFSTVKKQEFEKNAQKICSQSLTKQKIHNNQSSQKSRQFQKKLNYNLAQSTQIEDYNKNLTENLNNMSSQESEFVESVDIQTQRSNKLDDIEGLAKNLKMKKKSQQIQKKQQVKPKTNSVLKYGSGEKVYSKNIQQNCKHQQISNNLKKQNIKELQNSKYEQVSQRKILNKSFSNSNLYQSISLRDSALNDREDKQKQHNQQIYNQNFTDSQNILYKCKSLPGLVINNQQTEEQSNNKCKNLLRNSNMSNYHFSILYQNSFQNQSQKLQQLENINNKSLSKDSDGKFQPRSDGSIKNLRKQVNDDENSNIKKNLFNNSQLKYQQNQNQILPRSLNGQQKQNTLENQKIIQNQYMVRTQKNNQQYYQNECHQQCNQQIQNKRQKYQNKYQKILLKQRKQYRNKQLINQIQKENKINQENKDQLNISQINSIEIVPHMKQVHEDQNQKDFVSRPQNRQSNHEHMISFHRKSSVSSNQQTLKQQLSSQIGNKTVKQPFNKYKMTNQQVEGVHRPNPNKKANNIQICQNNNQIIQSKTPHTAGHHAKNSFSINQDCNNKFDSTHIKRFNQIDKKKYYDRQINTAKTQKSGQSVAQSTLKTIKLINHPLNVQKSGLNQTYTDCSYLLNQIRSRTSKLGNDELVSVVSHSQGVYGQYMKNPEQKYREDEKLYIKDNQTSQKMMTQIEKLQFENQNLKSYNRVLLQKLSNSRPKKY